MILSVTLMALPGCATKSRATRTAVTVQSTQEPLIIDRRDIDSSPDSSPTSRPVKSAAISGTSRKHQVKSGETLWAISKLYGLDVDTLARANSLVDSKTIEVGQVLLIPSSRSQNQIKTVNYSVRRSSTFIWPVRGDIASRFGSKTDKFVNKGIDIRAVEGADVSASRSGKVVYCDAHLKGFGQTVIVDHMDGFQTVYSYNQDISVKLGDMVEQRDIIAKVGSSGRARESMLHFEIRKNGEPQNPEFYLSR